MDEDLTLDELNAQLGEIQDRLSELGSSDFAEKHRLKTEQDRLRKMAGKYRQERDKNRPTEELLAELKARQSSLDEFRKKMPEAAKAAGSGLTAGSWSGPGDVTQVNETMKSAQGIEAQMQRIAHLEGILKERGAL